MTGGNDFSHRSGGCQVRVGVRVRPLASKEIQQGGKTSLTVHPPSSIQVASHTTFTYDAVFNAQTDQGSLYESVSSPLLNSFVEGFNATILAYGQTGSGKTYTMGSEAHTQPEGSSQVGLIPRFISAFFEQMQLKQQASDEASKVMDKEDCTVSDATKDPILLDYNMKASFLEVYGEDVYDLLDSERRSLPLREDSAGGVIIAGLTSKAISSTAEALHVLHEGTNNRTTAATLMNFTSSRSHAVFTIYLTQLTRAKDRIEVVSKSKFTFVDLAGSERLKKTGAEGERAREGIKINEGLLALGNVINALADEGRLAKEKSIHVPYRQSKLTRLLQDALGGNSQTFFLACVSPSDTNVSETLSTLRYANRARNIRNAPTKNLDATSSEIQRLSFLTCVLQSELIKARFETSDSRNGEITEIGQVDADLAKRPDVEEYLDNVYKAANELSGLAAGPGFVFRPMLTGISTDSVISSSKGLLQVPISSSPPVTPTVGKITSERHDESFLVDVNPEHDMAILDRLLELQQHDHEFDETQRHGDEKVKKIDGEIYKEETLLLQLRESLKTYQSLKKKYEELMAAIQKLEMEKETLAEKLEKATDDPSIGCSAAIQRQLETVELSLNRARRETLSHRQKYKAVEDQARRCKVLERKISDLKQSKMNLLKMQKQTAVRHKEFTEAKTKELLALQRKEKYADIRLSKMKTEIQHHKSNLEKRKQYCEKLSEKLKKTEAHLMRLLSVRQRDLVERANCVRRKCQPIYADEMEKNQDIDNEPLSSEDVKSMEFICDNMITNRIEDELRVRQYKDRFAEYSDVMRLVVTNVKTLKKMNENVETASDGETMPTVAELKEIISEQELRLELLDSEAKELESLLPDDSKRKLEEAAVKRLMIKLPSAALRKMVLDFCSKLVSAETERRCIVQQMSRKDAALSSLENESDLLNAKLETLTKDLVERRAHLGDDDKLYDKLETSEKAKRTYQEQLKIEKEKVILLDARLMEMEGIVKLQKLETENAKDYLALAETLTSKVGESVESKVTLKELHDIWQSLGVDSQTRETVRNEIKFCVSRTCRRHLDEATELLAATRKEIHDLEIRNAIMQGALDSRAEVVHGELTLFEQLNVLRSQAMRLQSSYLNRARRREHIISDMIALSTAMEISTDDLPSSLQPLMLQIENEHAVPSRRGKRRRASIMENVQAMVDSISDDLGEIPKAEDEPPRMSSFLPTGSLNEDFLAHCEEGIAELRVRKSEMMVRNRENFQTLSDVVKSLHAHPNDLADLIEDKWRSERDGIPVWWEKKECLKILNQMTGPSVRMNGDAFETRCIDAIGPVLSALAARRKEVANVLQDIVERAQQTLLDIVGRELDASEAYASFHEALLKLPNLSMEFSHSCISEMEALVIGIETMTQSEIEALTVVWEALKVSAKDRRAFWGRFDDTDYSGRSDQDNPFDCLVGETQDSEKWIHSLIEKGRQVNFELELKLSKLASIHKEVEKLRSKQDTKSQVLSLDNEIRILNSRLLNFEDIQCNKQRLLTKKSGSTALLKEARFRKQMKAKFVAKLRHLATLLRSWEQEEGSSFNSSILSDDVRMLLSEPNKMDAWIDQRTRLMPSRTVPAGTPRKRSLDTEMHAKLSVLTPTKRLAAASQPKKVKTSKGQERANETSSGLKETKLPAHKRKSSHSAGAFENVPVEINEVITKSPVRKRAATTRRKDSCTLPPFGRILSELASPDDQGKT